MMYMYTNDPLCVHSMPVQQQIAGIQTHLLARFCAWRWCIGAVAESLWQKTDICIVEMLGH